MRRSDRLRTLVASACLAGAAQLCAGGASAGPEHAEPERAGPERVVSINLCTDQLAMLLAREDQLISVSRIALDRRVSPMADEAEHYTINSGRAEEVHVLQPDLVVAGIYTSRETVAMLRRLGIEVVQFDIVHSLADVRDRMREMGAALGRQDAAEAMVARFDADLAALRSAPDGQGGPEGPAPRAALYYANGYTSGTNSLANDILAAAGLRNAPAEAGYDWGKLPLEMLAMIDPDLVITARRYPGGSRAEEVMDHPVVNGLRGQGAGMTDQDWVCGTPFVLRAIADMAEARRMVRGRE
ncbi:MAG: ABC transporter substrate-binding protein [Roseovarius sp.]